MFENVFARSLATRRPKTSRVLQLCTRSKTRTYKRVFVYIYSCSCPLHNALIVPYGLASNFQARSPQRPRTVLYLIGPCVINYSSSRNEPTLETSRNYFCFYGCDSLSCFHYLILAKWFISFTFDLSLQALNDCYWWNKKLSSVEFRYLM